MDLIEHYEIRVMSIINFPCEGFGIDTHNCFVVVDNQYSNDNLFKWNREFDVKTVLTNGFGRKNDYCETIINTMFLVR